MNLDNARRLVEQLPASAKVIDVGGGASPFPRADYVIDALPYESQGTGSSGSIHRLMPDARRFTKDTWIQWDLCEQRPWPISDKAFDFAVCSHLLEDIRDPIWVCHELNRIAHAGYIEVPSRVEEQSTGVEHPRYAGYYHHRWLISHWENGLEFRHKPHLLHSVNDAIVTRLKPGRRINPVHAIVTLEWRGSFRYREVLEFSDQRVMDGLVAFAPKRELGDLTVRVPMSFLSRVKRSIYFRRLSRGRQ